MIEMVYTIRIEGMEFRAAHGCYDVEQRVGGNFIVDVALDVALDVEDGGGAVDADDISQTVNYIEVYEMVREQMAIPSRIIENVAWRVAEAVGARFPQVRRAEVTVAKLAPPLGGKAAKVSATIVK